MSGASRQDEVSGAQRRRSGSCRRRRGWPERSGGGGAGPEAELVEAHTELVGTPAEHRGEHPQVVAADGEEPAVEVLALELDRGRVPGEHGGLRLVEPVQLHEVDGEAGLEIRDLGEVDLDVRIAWEQLVRRDLVDLGEPQQSGHRDRALAALVRAEHARLELETAARLDVVQRQPLLASDGPQAFPDMHMIHVSTTAPRDTLFAPSRA